MNQDTDTLETLVVEKLEDCKTPGFIAEFSPEEAELAGAFPEDGLSLFEALQSALDALEL